MEDIDPEIADIEGTFEPAPAVSGPPGGMTKRPVPAPPAGRARQVVVVDLPHRVSDEEKAQLQADINSGRIIVPPASTNGAGDAMVLAIADRDNALIVRNDSFQPFQESYPWVREGRLIGATRAGDGWIFLPRVPPRPRVAAAPLGSPPMITPNSLALKPPSPSIPVGYDTSHWWSGE